MKVSTTTEKWRLAEIARWIIIIPVIIIIFVVAQFFINVGVQASLKTIGDYAFIIFGNYGLGLATIIIAADIAPKFKFQTAIFLAGALIVFLAGLASFLLANNEFSAMIGTASSCGIIGALVGVFGVRDNS